MKAEQRSSIRKAISLNILINYDLAYSKGWKARTSVSAVPWWK